MKNNHCGKNQKKNGAIENRQADLTESVRNDCTQSDKGDVPVIADLGESANECERTKWNQYIEKGLDRGNEILCGEFFPGFRPNKAPEKDD